MTRVAGIDGCRGGWFALIWSLAESRLDAVVAQSWDALDLRAVTITAVDMPVGLTDRGPRICDRTARDHLPRNRKSCVFPAPRRYMLESNSWAEAQSEGRRRESCGLPVQAWGILPKIREIDAAITPAAQDCIREVHPELVFHHLNAGAPLAKKRSHEGKERRRDLLLDAGLPDLALFLSRWPRAKVAVDDILDAGACALAAKRILEGQAVCLPDNPPRDSRGLRMEIWF